jgi:hypothetical protein
VVALAAGVCVSSVSVHISSFYRNLFKPRHSIRSHGFSISHATPYPPSVTVIRAVGIALSADCTGPIVGLVDASIVSMLAELKFPSPDKSTITVRGAPVPLLSVAEATAWSSTITITDPSAFFVASVSTVVVSVAVNCKMSGPAEAGVDG